MGTGEQSLSSLGKPLEVLDVYLRVIRQINTALDNLLSVCTHHKLARFFRFLDLITVLLKFNCAMSKGLAK